jgi:hypothetical protein
MAMVGARTIRDFQQAELVLAPSIKTEGKQIQQAQSASETAYAAALT